MTAFVFHDSHDLKYRQPFGAVPCGEKVQIRLKIDASAVFHSVRLHLLQDDHRHEVLPMEKTEEENESSWYSVQFTVPSSPTWIWYYFSLESNGKTYYYGSSSEGLGGIGKMCEAIPYGYQITVHQSHFPPPHWLKDAIMYQIFVDRFANGNDDGKILNPKKGTLLHSHWDNDPVYIRDEKGGVIYWDFFGGNLLGIQKKLPYLKEMGVKVIYLNPIFEAASNHKYDTGDYHKIDPMFGDEQIFRDLIEEAKKQGIYIILDGVFSHTGSDSLYFNKDGNYPSLGAYQSKESPYYSWYRFIDYPDSYESWWGVDVLPNVNELEPAYQDFIIHGENSVLKYWQKFGVKGWRLDVADELPDSFIQAFNQTMKEKDRDAVLIGEVWEDASNKISYGIRRQYLIGDELDSVTNYPFRNAVIDFLLGHRNAKAIHQALMKLYEHYPIDHFYSLMNILGSHDTPRILTVLQEELPSHLSIEEKREIGIKRLKLASLWQMTFPGVPCIFYGDEAGIEGEKEPLNRRTYPWGKENSELLAWYKNLTALRNQHDVLKTGSWHSFYFHDDVYGYIRLIEKETDLFQQKKSNNMAVILLNRNREKEQSVSFQVKEWGLADSFMDVLNQNEILSPEYDGSLYVTLKPLEGKILLHQ